MKRLVLVVVLIAAILPLYAQLSERNRADLNGDGVVNFDDFVIFANNFGKTGIPYEPGVADTVVVMETVRDTVLMTETVRDTVTISSSDVLPRLEETDWQTIYNREERNIYWLGVGVEEEGYQWVFSGTGFAVSWYMICTNAHVITALNERAETIRNYGLSPVYVAIPAHRSGQSAILLRKHENGNVISFWHPDYNGVASPDVGLLFTQRSMPSFCRLASTLHAMELEVGAEIATIGYPGEIDSYHAPSTRHRPTLKTGTISALRPYDEETHSEGWWGYVANRMVQHNFDTTGGTSGSPIFNKRGEVIAVNNSGYEEGSLGFGIRADEARTLLRASYVSFLKNNPDGELSPQLLANLTKPTVNH